jgi:hypothetical protein
LQTIGVENFVLKYVHGTLASLAAACRRMTWEVSVLEPHPKVTAADEYSTHTQDKAFEALLGRLKAFTKAASIRKLCRYKQAGQLPSQAKAPCTIEKLTLSYGSSWITYSK